MFMAQIIKVIVHVIIFMLHNITLMDHIVTQIVRRQKSDDNKQYSYIKVRINVL